jgi:hypothetical protein
MQSLVRTLPVGALSCLVLGIGLGCSEEEDCETRCERRCAETGVRYADTRCGPSGECYCIDFEPDADVHDGRDADDAGAPDFETSPSEDTGESVGDVEAADAEVTDDADVTPRT